MGIDHHHRHLLAHKRWLYCCVSTGSTQKESQNSTAAMLRA
jgi:hypothetical protein